MATLTLIVPDDIAVMALFKFAQDNQLRSYWKDPTTIEMRRPAPKVVNLRERGPDFHPYGVVVPQDDPTPPRAA